MMVFIWKSVENLTSRYHPEGGLVIVAHDLAEARKMAGELAMGNDTLAMGAVEALEPDLSLTLARQQPVSPVVPEVIVFPDAGCC